VEVELVSIELDGSVPVTSNGKFPNVGGGSLDAAAQNCYPHCAALGVGTGPTQCDDIFIAQVLASNTWDCYLLSSGQDGGSNLVSDSGVGQAALFIVIVA